MATSGPSPTKVLPVDAWVKNCTLTGALPFWPKSNCSEDKPVRSIPPQQPLEKGTPVSRIVLKASVKAWLPPTAVLVSVTSKAPPGLARVALVFAAPKFRTQSLTPAEFHEYSTAGVWAPAGATKRPSTASAREMMNHRRDFIRTPPPLCN